MPRGTRPARRPPLRPPGEPCAREACLLPQISQLNALITLLIGNLSAGDRMKIMTICTIDVHARDVVAKMITTKAWVPGGARNQGGGLGLRTPAHIPHPSHCFFLSGAGGHFSRQRLPRSAPLISPLVSHWTSSPIRSAPGSAVGAVLGLMGAPGEGRGAGSTPGSRTAWRQASLLPPQVESSQAFTWQSQLRHRWDEEKKHCFANICDAQIQYSYEYLGNTPRLVITPLTDR